MDPIQFRYHGASFPEDKQEDGDDADDAAPAAEPDNPFNRLLQHVQRAKLSSGSRVRGRRLGCGRS